MVAMQTAERTDLQDVFRYLNLGQTVASMSSSQLAGQISQGIEQWSQGPPSGPMWRDVEELGLGLTLITKIINKLLTRKLCPEARCFYDETVRSLIRSAAVSSGLMHLLDCRDRILSHLSAKCFSSLLLHHLCDCGGMITSWTSWLNEMPRFWTPDRSLDTRLWVLTHVIKRVLCGDVTEEPEVLKMFLCQFEVPLTALYSNLLLTDPIDDAISICALLDLLEVLTAARRRLGLLSSTQRLIFLQTSVLLHLTCGNLEDFVKKRALLLLKRSLVHRAGEDSGLAVGQRAPQDDCSLADLLAMANTVLKETDAAWLCRLCVKPGAGHFGGSGDASGGERDAVMLRAVCLILLRSLQIKLQHHHPQDAPPWRGVQHYLLKLLDFVRLQKPQVKGAPHCCCWMLDVFTDQDDDLMEASRTLTSLYFYQKRFSSELDLCAWGCNSHCHFILLLQSLSFDHTVLLDLLISSETCFLEYFVLYLRHVRDHRQDFLAACRRVAETQTGLFGPESETDSCRVSPVTCQHPAPPLVDYESSEEEQEEEEEEEERSHVEGQTVLRSAERVNPAFGNVLSERVVCCVMELQTVISRLHGRGLFPYNPIALLRLLSAFGEATQK